MKEYLCILSCEIIGLRCILLGFLRRRRKDSGIFIPMKVWALEYLSQDRRAYKTWQQFRQHFRLKDLDLG